MAHISCVGIFFLPLRRDDNGLPIVFEMFVHYLDDYLVHICVFLGPRAFLRWHILALGKIDVKLEIHAHEEAM